MLKRALAWRKYTTAGGGGGDNYQLWFSLVQRTKPLKKVNERQGICLGNFEYFFAWWEDFECFLLMRRCKDWKHICHSAIIQRRPVGFLSNQLTPRSLLRSSVLSMRTTVGITCKVTLHGMKQLNWVAEESPTASITQYISSATICGPPITFGAEQGPIRWAAR